MRRCPTDVHKSEKGDRRVRRVFLVRVGLHGHAVRFARHGVDADRAAAIAGRRWPVKAARACCVRGEEPKPPGRDSRDVGVAGGERRRPGTVCRVAGPTTGRGETGARRLAGGERARRVPVAQPQTVGIAGRRAPRRL